MEVSKDNIKIAQFVAKAIGFEPQVYPYYDNDKKNQLDILNLTDPIDKNVAIYCTLGLSDHVNMVEMNDNPVNVPIELLLTSYKKYDKAPNILSTISFYIIKDKFECRPGTVFMRMIEMYYPDSSMKHVYFTEPFLWQNKLDQLELESKKVEFLLCIPLSEEELQYKIENGNAALEELFEKNNIEVFDLNRQSVV